MICYEGQLCKPVHGGPGGVLLLLGPVTARLHLIAEGDIKSSSVRMISAVHYHCLESQRKSE